MGGFISMNAVAIRNGGKYREIQTFKNPVESILNPNSCRLYNMTTAQAVGLGKIIWACRYFPYVIIDNKKFFRIDDETFGDMLVLSPLAFKRNVIDPLCGSFRDNKNCKLPPVLLRKRVKGNLWYISLNKDAAKILLIDKFLGEVMSLFELDDDEIKSLNEAQRKPKQRKVEGIKPERNMDGYSQAVTEIYRYCLNKKLPDGSKLFRHPDLSAKCITQAIGRIHDLYDGTFFDKIKIHESFWRNGPERRLGGVQGEITQLAFGHRDKFVERIKQAIDNYAEAFIDGKEPMNKDLLTNSMNEYFFNIGIQRSYFVYYFRFPADDMREKIADTTWLKLPAAIRSIGDKIYRESMDAKAFWDNINRMYKRAFLIQKDYTSEISYWYSTPKDLIEKFYTYILEELEFDADSLTAKHFSLKGKTFKSYLNKVRQEYSDVSQEVVDVFVE